MRRNLGPLLCELHSHTRWSDGVLTIAELVDLHGQSGFDVLCITDHVVRGDDPWRETEGVVFRSVDERGWDSYLAEIEHEAARAWRTYGMLVVPGLELTFNHDDPALARDPTVRGLAHRFELFNRTQLYSWVAEAGLPAVATGDFHHPEHLVGWKTLLPSLQDETAVVDYLRSPRPVYLIRLEPDTRLLAA